MDELEKRLLKVESTLERMEQAIEKMANAVEQLAESRIRSELQNKEVERLRVAIHKHANMLEHVPMLEANITKLEDTMNGMRGGISDTRTETMKLAGVISVISVVLILVLKGLLQ